MFLRSVLEIITKILFIWENLKTWTSTVTSGIRPPADSKGPPLNYFEKSIFGWLTLNIFSGAIGANVS